MKWIILTMEEDTNDNDGLNYNINKKVKYSI